MQRVRSRLNVLDQRTALMVGVRYGAVLAAIALATVALAPLRPRLGLVTIGLLYLLLVVVVAVRWGWGPALVASVVANLAFNFFFVPPLHTFTVGEPANVLALLVFLGVAALTSALLARAKAGEAAARHREQETAILYDLSRLIIGDADLASILSTICRRVRETFDAESCAVLLPGPGGPRIAGWSGRHDEGPETTDERRAADQALTRGVTVALGGLPGQRGPRIVGVRGRRAPVAYVPLRVGGTSAGLLRVVGRLHARVFTADELRLLEAFADQAAPAVERDRLLHEAARAEALQEADRLKSALLAAVSHDLRTPLTAILASVSSLLQADVAWDESTRHQFLTAIQEQTVRLTRLVSNLLDLSRIEGGALRPEKDWYDVGELLESVAANAAASIGRRRIELDTAGDVGVVRLDHVEISQVVTNLIENAAKFSPDGSTIRVTTRRSGDEIVIMVDDEGSGIPAAERERVFEKFYRVTDNGPRAPGTGLGLAICKGFVEAHGGRIRAEGAPAGGARFTVTLPAPLPVMTPDEETAGSTR